MKYVLASLKGVLPKESQKRDNCLGFRLRQGDVKVSTGIVKWFNSNKGYGFIAPDDGGDDLFVHYSEIQTSGYATLEEGQKVEYEVGQGRKGPCATSVKLI